MVEEHASFREFRRRMGALERRRRGGPWTPAQRAQFSEAILALRPAAVSDPHGVADLLTRVLNGFAVVAAETDSEEGLPADLASPILDVMRCVFERLAGSPSGDARVAVLLTESFRIGGIGPFAVLPGFEAFCLELCTAPGLLPALTAALEARLRELPIPFPLPSESDYTAVVRPLVAQRLALERLLGEALAAQGATAYSVLVARAFHRRTGEALGLVRALARDGRPEEARDVARRALASPRGRSRAELLAVLDEIEAASSPATTRSRRRSLEKAFLDAPSRAAFEELRQATAPENWARVAGRVLGHLQRHQRQPSLVFELRLELGDVLEADGLATTHPVRPEVLAAAAARVQDEHPGIAAGWLLIAAHRLADRGSARSHTRIVAHLQAAGVLARATGQSAGFAAALARFRARHQGRTALLRRLDQAGL